MTSFLIGADSTVNRLPGKFIKLSRARNRFLKSNKQNKLKVKAYNFDEFHNLPIAINKLPLSGNSSILPTVFWAYHCTCGAHYQGIYDRFKYTIPIVKCEDCGKEVKEIILKSFKDIDGEKRDASVLDILQIAILIILLMFCFIYLFKDYIHIPLDID